MSTSTQTPPPEKTPEKPPIPVWPRWDDDTDSQRDLRLSVTAGLAVTVLIHMALALSIPWDRIDIVEVRPQEQPPPMEVEFLPPPLPRFVETNPDVSPDRPEDTDNIAAQDQVAAQEEPDPLDDSDTPMVDGELPDSAKIVEGSMEETPPPVPEGVLAPQVEPAPPVPEQEPLPETLQDAETHIPEMPEAEPSPQEAAPEALEQAPAEDGELLSREEPVETVAEEPVEEAVEAGAPPDHDPRKIMMEEVLPQQAVQSGEPVPQARPRINYRVPSGPLVQNARSANRMGHTSVDANFSEFGAYQQRMIEAISAQWNLLGSQARYTGADIGTNVVVEFVLDRNGVAHDVRVLHTNSSTAGAMMTTDAIKSRSPYGVWTQDMIRVLGERQTVRITFHYR